MMDVNLTYEWTKQARKARLQEAFIREFGTAPTDPSYEELCGTVKSLEQRVSILEQKFKKDPSYEPIDDDRYPEQAIFAEVVHEGLKRLHRSLPISPLEFGANNPAAKEYDQTFAEMRIMLEDIMECVKLRKEIDQLREVKDNMEEGFHQDLVKKVKNSMCLRLSKTLLEIRNKHLEQDELDKKKRLG